MTVAIEREAACSCGQLRVRAVGDPRIVSSCHCLACQRRTGALFGATAFFPRSQIAATEGAYKTWRRRGDSGGVSYRLQTPWLWVPVFADAKPG